MTQKSTPAPIAAPVQLELTFDRPAPDRRPAGDGCPWSCISDWGEAKLPNGKRYFFYVSRTFDPREPQGQRVEWEVELSALVKRSPRKLPAHTLPELRKSILEAFKGRIEADNAKREEAFSVESGLEEVKPSDPYADLKHQETAKRIMEVALVGGHSVAFEAEAGHSGQWTSYDLERLSADNRKLADWWVAHFPDNDATGLEAAKKQASGCLYAFRHLSALSGLEPSSETYRGEGIAIGEGVALSCLVGPISLVDLVFPAPTEGAEPVAKRITEARSRRNASMNLDAPAQALLEAWRGYVRPSEATAAAVIEWARSIQALSDRDHAEPAVTRLSLAEAIAYSREA